MKLAVFGATGQTGEPLVNLALSLGNEIVALVRNPSKIKITNKNLTVIQGDVTNFEDVERVIKGTNAVISVLNTQRNVKNMPITKGMKNIVLAMSKHTIRRIVVSAAAPSISDIHDGENKGYYYITGLIGRLVKALFPFEYEDLVSSMNIIKESDLDWTIVRMPVPTNTKKNASIGFGYVDNQTKLKIARKDAAKFILSEITETRYLKHAVVVYNI